MALQLTQNLGEQLRQLNRNPSNKSYKSYQNQISKQGSVTDQASKTTQQASRSKKPGSQEGTPPHVSILVAGSPLSSEQIKSDAERLQQYVHDQIRHQDSLNVENDQALTTRRSNQPRRLMQASASNSSLRQARPADDGASTAREMKAMTGKKASFAA